MHEGVYGGVRAFIAQNLRSAVGDRRPRLGIQEHTVIANAEQARKFVADHDDGDAEAVAQALHQIIEMPCRYWIEPGRRLIEKQNGRIQGECPGKSDTLAHAAAQIRGHALSAGFQSDE